MSVVGATKAVSIHYNSLYIWINEYEEYERVHSLVMELCPIHVDVK